MLFFLCDVIGLQSIKKRDAEIICSHAFGKRYLSVQDLISYCLAFGWIKKEASGITLQPSLSPYVNDKESLNKELIQLSVKQLFADGVLNPFCFSYDTINDSYSFKNELLPLSFATIRNVLISQGFIRLLRQETETRFYIASEFDDLIASFCKARRRTLSLERLKKQLEDNEAAGEQAELFVLEFEKKRIGQPLCQRIKRISPIDAAAGFDVVSFESPQSLEPDRFIEVKAVSSTGFYWSKNERDISKLLGEKYHLYLVQLQNIGLPDYTPEIIQNPSLTIVESSDWIIEPESFHVNKIDLG